MTNSKGPKSIKRVLEINEKHKRFVDEYLIDFNGTRAYSIAYNVENNASAQQGASKLLNCETVKKLIEEKVEERNQQTLVDRTYVIQKLLAIVECDFMEGVQYYDEEGMSSVPLAIRKMVQGIKFRKTTHEDGSTEKNYEFNFMSKDKALDTLVKYTGALTKDDDTLGGKLKGFAEIVKGLKLK